MENKKSFILYTDLIHTVRKLPNDKAGELFKHILSYVNDENPETNDLIINISFEPIKQQLKRDLAHWEQIITKRSLAGKASADKRKQNQHMSTHVESVKQKEQVSTVNVNDTVNVTVNDNVINKKKYKQKNENFELFWDHFHEHVKQPKSKKDPTLKHWNKLSLDEQRKAYASVKKYANSKPADEHEYLSIARTYLADKLYNDEYGTSERLPNKEKILALMKKLENEKS